MTRVWVAASSATERSRLEAAVAASGRLELAGGSIGLGAAAGQIAFFDPDVLLVELGRPRDRPFQPLAAALRAVRYAGEEAREPAIVVLADFGSVALADAVRHGIRGILPRQAPSVQVVMAIEAAAAGLIVRHPDSTAGSLERHLRPADSRPPDGVSAEPLTAREGQVLNLLAEGLGNKEIAARLGVSEHTAKFHVASILSKLGAASRTEAVTLGIRQGLVML